MLVSFLSTIVFCLWAVRNKWVVWLSFLKTRKKRQKQTNKQTNKQQTSDEDMKKKGKKRNESRGRAQKKSRGFGAWQTMAAAGLIKYRRPLTNRRPTPSWRRRDAVPAPAVASLLITGASYFTRWIFLFHLIYFVLQRRISFYCFPTTIFLS